MSILVDATIATLDAVAVRIRSRNPVPFITSLSETASKLVLH